MLRPHNEQKAITKAHHEQVVLSHVFQQTRTFFIHIQDIIQTNILTNHKGKNALTMFKLVQDIMRTNLLTKFHDDLTINVDSRVPHPLGGHDRTIIVASRVLTRNKMYEDQNINEKCPAPSGHVFQPTGIIFILVRDIIVMNLRTKFHIDWTINVASRVLTRFYYSHIRKNAPPLCSPVFQANIIIFELIKISLKPIF
ncbi:hypothetical protein DPMN_095717 [Dreissena polymorpha]|uniref:Uncharacterized protein n=1 Tax=Dreissena polymorpha TaxID=45954 RepID=A0A9D4L850_DREPO|nr:hypothetical protein DPMN_095717 [Dreissena polymorpha]